MIRFRPLRGQMGLAVLLYGAICLVANPVMAGGLTEQQVAAIEEMREGTMRKLVVHDKARARIEVPFKDAEGNEVRLADYAGKVVVVNFWATWCPPCRKEMPGLDRLAGEMGGDDLAVLAISTDRLGVERVRAFFEEIGVEHLTLHLDRRGKVALKAAAPGLPVTLILDREGREIARLQGEAEWDATETKALLARLIEMTAAGS